MQVFFETPAGIISIGILQRGRDKIVVCSRTGRIFSDVPTWRNRAEYDALVQKHVLSRDRRGTLGAAGRDFRKKESETT